MANKIGAKIVLDGENEFRKAITAINQDMKVNQSQLSLLSEKYKSNANSLEALREKNKLLSEQFELQKKKIEATRTALEGAQSSYTNAGTKVDQLKKELSEATERLEEMNKGSSASAEELEKQQTAVDGLSIQLKKAEEVYQNCDNKVDKWSISLNEAERKLYQLDEGLIENKKYMDEAESSTDETAISIDEFGKKIKVTGNNTAETVETVDEFGNKVEEAGKAITAINNDMKVNQSELSLLSEKYKSNANSLEALREKNKLLSEQFELQKKKIEATRTALEGAQSSYTNAGTKVDQLKKELSEATERLEEMNKGSSASAEELEKQQTAVDGLSIQLKKAEEVYQNCDNEVDNWNVSLNEAERKLYQLDVELKDNKKYMTEAENSTDETAKSIDEYGKEVKEAEKETSVFGEVLKANLAGTAIVAGVKAIVGAIKEVSKVVLAVGGDFKESMSQVAATMGMTADEIEKGSAEYEKLEEAAKKCGATTKYTASQAAEALNYLALAGYNAEKSIAALPVVLDTAAAGNLDLAFASDMITDSMSALGIETKELTNFTDQLAKTSQKSNTNIAQLGEGIITAGGAAKYLSGGTAELNTELGILADSGIKGSEGGTKLRNAIMSLMAPTDRASDEIKALGLNILDTEGNLRPLNEVFGDLNHILSDMSEGDQAKALEKIFNKQDLAAINALLKDSGERFDELNEQIINCEGSAAAMASTMQKNLKGEMTEFGSSVEGLGITIFEKFDKPLQKAVATGTEGIGKLAESIEDGKLSEPMERLGESVGRATDGLISFAIDAMPPLIDGFTWVLDNGAGITSALSGISAAIITYKAAEGISSAVTAFKLLKTTTDSATLSQTALNAAQAANPAGLVAAAVAGLATAFVVYAKTAEKSAMESAIFAEECSKIREETESLKGSMEDLRGEREDGIRVAEEEARAAEILSDKLYSLSNKEKKTSEDKKNIVSLTKQLNDLVPDLCLKYDEEANSLNRIKSETDELIRANKDLYVVKALEDTYVKTAEKQAEAELILVDIANQKKEKEEELIKLHEKKNEIMEKGKGIETEDEYRERIASVMFYSGEIKKLEQGMADLDAATNAANDTITQCGTEWGKTEALINEHGGIKESTEALDNMGESADAASMQLQELMQQYNKDLDKTRQDIVSSMGLFGEFANSTKVSGETLTKNLKSQIQGMEDWQKNIKSLSERCSQDFILELKNMGLDSAAEIAALAKMSDKELKEYEALWRERSENIETISVSTHEETKTKIDTINKEITEESKKEAGEAQTKIAEAIEGGRRNIVLMAEGTKTETVKASDMQTEGKQIGEEYVNGIITGLQNKKGMLGLAARTVAAGMHKASKQELSINSPSKKAEKEIGGEYVNGVAKGIEKNKYKAIDAVAGMSKLTLEKGKEWIDRYKVYNEMSLREEMVFWQLMQRQHKKGTKERLEIDKNYLSAKERLNEQSIKAQTDYKEKLEKITGDLKADVDGLTKKYEDAVTARKNSITGSMSLFEAFELKTEKTATDLLNNLQTQTEGLRSWAETLVELKSKIKETELVEELQNMGPGALAELQALNTMTEEELDKYVELWKEKQGLAREQAITELEPLKEDTAKKIKEITKVATEELSKQKTDYLKQLMELGVDVLTLGEEETVKKLKNIGEKAIAGLTEEAKKKADSKDAKRDLNTIVQSVSKQLEPMQKTANTIGVATTDNLTTGIISKKQSLTTEAFQVGVSAMDGLIGGVESKKQELKNLLDEIMRLTSQINSSTTEKESMNPGSGGKTINQEINVYTTAARTIGETTRALKQAQREAALEL